MATGIEASPQSFPPARPFGDRSGIIARNGGLLRNGCAPTRRILLRQFAIDMLRCGRFKS